MNSVNWEEFWKQEADTYKTTKERNIKASKLIDKGTYVLDVGCGHGELMELIQPTNDVFGIDFTMKMLEDCFKKGLKVMWGEAENIPFCNNHFDVVCALGLIEYLSEDEKFINEVYRVLKPNGTLVVSFRNSLF